MRLLDKIIRTLPAAQQLAVRTLLEDKRRRGQIRSLREQQAEADRVFANVRGKLGNILLDPVFAEPDSKISSEEHNQNMEAMFLDLNTLYSQIDRLASQQNQHSITLSSEYGKSRAAVEKLLTDVRTFALRKKFPDFNEVKIIDFNSSQNKAKKIPPATVNDRTRLLELTSLDATRVQMANRLHRTTKVYTRTISPGIRGALSKEFKPELMTDQRPETFWGTLTMTDAPVKQRHYLSTDDNKEREIEAQGPITEVFFRFSHAEKVNTIRVLPFAEYPVKIVDVAYRSSAASQIFTAIDDFEEVSTLDWVEMNFNPIFAHEIRLTLVQENPKRVIYHLPKRVVSNTDLFHEVLRFRAQQIVGDASLESDFVSELLTTVDAYTTAIESVEEILDLAHIDVVTDPDVEFAENFMAIINTVLNDIDPAARSNLAEFFSNEDATQQPDEEILEVNKYEYITGIREIEIGYFLYAPTCYYESERFDVQATVSEIQMETDERHATFRTSWESGLRKTSTEWLVDIGDGRTVPIHPRNQVDDLHDPPVPATKDERIQFDRFTRIGHTRLGSRYGAGAAPYRLKKDGELIPREWYDVQLQADQAIPNLKITLSGEWFDENGLYTVDYAVSTDSYAIQVLELFQSRPLTSPEVFKELGPDNDLETARYPYVDYEVINRTGFFDKDEKDARWTWVPPQPNASTGQLVVFPTVTDDLGNILVTGQTGAGSIQGLYGPQSGLGPLKFNGNASLANQYFAEPFGYFVALASIQEAYEVTGFEDTAADTGIYWKSLPVLTETQVNRLPSGAFVGDLTGAGTKEAMLILDFTIGVGLKTDDSVFSFVNPEYKPIEVKVGGREAVNITDYETLRHPAFSVTSRRDTEYEFIHAGKKIYFNQPVKGQEVSVDYQWITEYVKVLGTLRCNKAVNPDLTPKVDEIRLLMNNLVI